MSRRTPPQLNRPKKGVCKLIFSKSSFLALTHVIFWSIANSFSNSADPAVENSAVSSCGSAEENLQWAIKQSVETVYRREHERLLGLYDAKMVEANEAFAAVKRHMNQWLYEVSKPRASSS